LTGWEIFSKVDAVKWNLNQAEDISQRVFRLLKGPSIPESNQRGKRNKNHMNPLIQRKKANPLFVITLVLACFALSPQAFAQVAKPTFSPPGYSGCKRWKYVKICSTTPGAKIYVWWGAAGGDMPNCGTINVGPMGTVFLHAFAYVDTYTNKSDNQNGTYRHSCSTVEVVLLVVGGILLAGVLIWLFRKRSSASR
jgi:hypothetical protein